MSIGVLGFVVWSWVLASPLSDLRTYIIYFAVSWNGLVLIGTLNGKNSISYTKSAGNLSLCSSESKIQSASETIRETSFNFSTFRQNYNTLFGNAAQHLSNNWSRKNFSTSRPGNLPGGAPREPEGTGSKNTINSVKVYDNADTQKLDILQENKNKSGIYLWVNQETRESYVGSAADLYKRLRIYYSLITLEKSLKRSKSRIHRALLKYGYSKFTLEILEYCDSKDLINREQYYLDLLKPEYNILKIAGSRLGSIHNEESRAKMSSLKTGRKLSEEIRAKMSMAKFGLQVGEKNPNFGEMSQDVKDKISKSKGSAVSILDLQTNEATVYYSGNKASEAISCPTSTFKVYLRSGKVLKNRYVLSKVIDKK